MMTKTEVYHTTETLAELLCVKPWTVRQWAREGRISFVRLGKKYLFSDEHVQEIVGKGEIERDRIRRF